MIEHFASREHAGQLLARRLAGMKLPAPRVVLALPRGGVPIGAAVAAELDAPLDLLFVRQIGLPWQPELALAAVVDGDEAQVVIDGEVARVARVEPGYIERQTRIGLQEIERRRRVYLGGRPPVPVVGATAIVVDDGIATGTSMRAALKALRRRQPARLVLAVPVAPSEAIDALRNEVDDIVCLAQPFPFHAIGLHYDDFHQLADAEVLAALAAAGPHHCAQPQGDH